ncbi:hypothetical protein F5Y08DRAFT_27281 [Xylaria arbuscula]|nr:hypothetical protein F5Y08DRAFT_27281 [Xylaria arbuscula]
MSSSFAQSASVSVSVGAGQGVGSQITLGSQTETEQTTTAPPLTTTFTPPSACETPLAVLDECYDDFHCDAVYVPFLYTKSADSPPVTCLPQTTVYSDGFVDGQFEYSPGLYCPKGMTTATSIANQYLCCPSGLTYSFDGKFDTCTGTVTEGVFWAGSVDFNSGTIARVITLSAADDTTMFLGAYPIWLTQSISHTIGDLPSQSTSSIQKETDSSTSSRTSSSIHTTTQGCFRRRDCQATPSPTIHHSSASSRLPLRVEIGAIVGGVIGFVLLALAAILLLRYRRRRLRQRHQTIDSPPTNSEATIQQYYLKKHFPELPVVEMAAELEGTQVEDHGPGAGIYVWKPELEGTAGMPGTVGVYVRKKSELEARYDGTFTGSPYPVHEIGSRTTEAAPESPIVGPSFIRYSVRE